MYSIFKILLDFGLEYKILIISYALCLIIERPVYSVIIPRISSIFFQQLTLNKNSSSEILKKICIKWVTYISICFLIVYFLGVVTKNLQDIILPNLNEYISNYLFKNILNKHENSFSEIDISEVYRQVTDVPHDIKILFNEMVKIIPNTLSFISVTIYLFYTNIYIGWNILISFIIIFIVTNYNFPICFPSTTKKYEAIRDIMAVLNNKLSNLYNIYSSGYLEEEVDDFIINSKNTTSKIIDSNNCLSFSTNITKCMTVLSTIAIFIQSSYLCINKKISTLELTGIILMTTKLNHIMYDMIASYHECVNIFTSLEISEPFTKSLYDSSEIDKKSKKKEIEIKNGNILFHNVSFNHDNSDTTFIEKFFLDIPDGQKIAIVGNSGCGKSTIVKLLMGYYPVPNDTITIDGICINKHKLSNMRKQITFISQNTRLFDDTVLKNIQYGNNMTREDIMYYINKTGTQSIFETLSDGLDTECGINGEFLSGGQKQLVQFIKNIKKDNKIIVLDEPTAAIDSKNTQNIVNAIQEISKNATLIIITHDKNILSIVDRVITMNNGKIINDVYTNN